MNLLPVKIEGKEMIVEFSSRYYPVDVIEQTIEAFDELITATVVDNKVRLQLKGEGDLEEIGLEFCNYALGTVSNAYVL